jgi:hypothetical protein
MRHDADVVITARNEGEITAAAQAVSAAHAGRRAIGVVATASSAEDFERVYELKRSPTPDTSRSTRSPTKSQTSSSKP